MLRQTVSLFGANAKPLQVLGISIDVLHTLIKIENPDSAAGAYHTCLESLWERTVQAEELSRDIHTPAMRRPLKDSEKLLLQLMIKIGKQTPREQKQKAFTEAYRRTFRDCLKDKQPCEQPCGANAKETLTFWTVVIRRMYEMMFNEYTAEIVNEYAQIAIEVKERSLLSSDLEPIAAELYQYFSTPSPYMLYPETKSILQDLRPDVSSSRSPVSEKETKIIPDGVDEVYVSAVTNSDGRIHNVLQKLYLSPYFHTVISAHEAKCLKPLPFGIELAIKRCQNRFPGAHVHWLHVGDSEADAIAAAEAGVKFLKVNPEVGMAAGDLTLALLDCVGKMSSMHREVVESDKVRREA